MRHLVTIVGHLKQPIEIEVLDDLKRCISEISNRFIIDVENSGEVFMQVAKKLNLLMQQGGMFGKKDPNDVVANHDVDLNNRFFVSVVNILYFDFETRLLSPSPVTEDVEGEVKEVIQ